MPACTPFQVRRHHSKLSEKETDEVVGILADLIVTYLKKGSGCSNRGSDAVRARRPQEGGNP
jgi:nucleoid DNA-binding protein